MRKGCLITIAILISLSILINLIPPSDEEKFQDSKNQYRNKNYKEALQLINELILNDTTNPDYYELRGMILFELKDTIHSHEDFEHTLMMSGSDAEKDARIKKLIDWDLDHNNTEEAKHLLQKEIKLYKNDSAKHVGAVIYAASKYISIGDSLEGLNLYLSLIEEYPHETYFRNWVGIYYANRKEYSKAIKQFNTALKTDANNHQLLYNTGICYLALNNNNKAKKYLKLSMELGNNKACSSYREITAVTKYFTRSKCCDGTTSSSTGRGTCSHHRGVCGIEYVPYKNYIINCY